MYQKKTELNTKIHKANMKIIRYRSSKKNEFCFGILIDNQVYHLEGDPLKYFEKGDKIAPNKDLETAIPYSPTKIIAAAINYFDKTDWNPAISEPLIFMKSPNSICGSHDDVISPFMDKQHWGVPEIAVVMKKRVFRPSRENIAESVLGYTSANDITVENVCGLNHHLARSKAADTFCPIGYFIDTDYDFRDKELKGIHGKRILFKGNTRTFVWNPHELIYQISQYMTLDPWDIILTGSPRMIGDISYLQPGDIFTVEIEGLPILRNRFLLHKSD